MNTIYLAKYGKPHPADDQVRFFLTLEEGKQTAIDCGLKDAVLAGPVDLRIPDTRETGMWTSRTRDNVRECWVKGFVGPVAREVGIDLFLKNVSFNGDPLSKNAYRTGVYRVVLNYLLDEKKRLEKKAEVDARKNGTTTWSAPGQLMVPDIGTVVTLTEDWTFRLFEESRNGKFLRKLGVSGIDCWRHYRGNGKMREFNVTVLAGSSLGVDRIYIRRGADFYSSITFNLHKGGQVIIDGKTIKAFGRFWAKLSDVNKLKVRIDMNTMAEN